MSHTGVHGECRCGQRFYWTGTVESCIQLTRCNRCGRGYEKMNFPAEESRRERRIREAQEAESLTAS